ncbi:hypothetical protein [Streptosporangium sp. NBC_01756]|uniref:hypothetical protein n=1 Tax=Streptosporangium sp. NBC_01756 TaxID=2975950 RepID=UPI002DDA1753|nr:hypothetical protein [Streptosporangium sp. NBC_01756]WSC89327.1 hypothetical protein OIE48_14405 [Streptosporangium sp. NBC_01756]
MSRVLTTMPAAALALAVLTGCGVEAAPSAAPATGKASTTADPHDRRRQVEAMRADCMKQKGFKYVPNVSARSVKDILLQQGGDYVAIRKYREKHGFGIFDTSAYPDDPEFGAQKPRPDPNRELARSLSATQHEAWTDADNACYAAVFNKFTGKKASSADDVHEQMDTLYLKTRERLLDGDPRLVELARDFGDCLKGKGYPVTSLRPTALEARGWDTFDKQRTAAMDKHRESGAEGIDALRLPPNLARPYLAKEIKAALDDLECGKDFYAAFGPEDTKLLNEIWDQFGRKDGLLPW